MFTILKLLRGELPVNVWVAKVEHVDVGSRDDSIKLVLELGFTDINSSEERDKFVKELRDKLEGDGVIVITPAFGG